MTTLDLSNIDPLKWAEVRRRAAAVTEYLSLDNPSAADRERFGAMLDLGALQFSNLVKAWVTHREATALAPGMHRARPSRSKRDGVDARARVVARETIAELGAAAPLPDLITEINRRCEAIVVVPPSRSSIWLLAVEARGRTVLKPDGIVVARAYLRLPVNIGGDIMFPEIVVAAETPGGALVDIALTRPAGDFDARRISNAITHGSTSAAVTVAMNEADEKALRRHLARDTDIRIVSPAEAIRSLSKAVGKRIGLVEITFRPPSVRPATVMKSGRDRALSVVDAELALIMARERHNAGLAILA